MYAACTVCCLLSICVMTCCSCRLPAAESSEQSKSGRVTEADLLGWIRFVLPAINLALKKAREVFSGDPATTLRVKIFTVLMTCLHLSLVLCNEFLFNLRFLRREILDNSLVLLGFWTSLQSIQINSSFRTKMWIFWTFQVAIVLWLVAKMGAGISIWSFLRFGASLSDHSS
jgi:hypothetical protein